MPNSDLEQLGLLLLQCMDWENGDKHTDVEQVHQQRALNRVFGLSKPELWSGSKQLMDFLDDLFNESKSAYAKVEKSVRQPYNLPRNALINAAPLSPRGCLFLVTAAIHRVVHPRILRVMERGAVTHIAFFF